MNPALHNPAVTGPAAPAAAPGRTPPPKAAPPQGPAFGEYLQKASSDLRFSGHALQRIQRRQLDVGPQTLQRLHDGIARAAAKGARDSVVFVDDSAFVVSVPNRTVITAVGRDQMREQVFTNIDTAVIA